MYVEHGYAKRYGVDDGELAELVGGIWTREQLIGGCDVILLPKVWPKISRKCLWGRSSGAGRIVCWIPP